MIALSFEEFTRDAVRRAARAIMMEEVEALCGPPHRVASNLVHASKRAFCVMVVSVNPRPVG